MKKIRTETYIEACKDYDNGMRVPQVCKKYGISEAGFYAWKKRYYGLKLNEVESVRRQSKLEKQLKHKVDEQGLIIKALQAALKKKF